ncbi:MAG TPA: nicotinamide riboside transporter PnuC [Caldimonas sp.]
MNGVLAAAAPLLAGAFVVWGAPVTWLEVVAFVLSIAMVVCNIRVNVIGWPLAIASSLLYLLLFWNSRLYGDASLQLFFAAVAAWGWWQWLRGTDEKGQALRVRSLGANGRMSVLVAIAIAWPATALFLSRLTDTDVPWWDAFPTATSVVGQWLLGRKYVENWPTWIVVDVVGAALFAYKGLWLTVLLYLVFVAMALVGWRSWLGKAAAPAAAP